MRPALLTFAEVCFAIVRGAPHAARGAAHVLEPVLSRLIAEARARDPRKPEWLIVSEIVLHLSERLLGQGPQQRSPDLAARKTSVHRSRSVGCGTYSTPDFVADQVTRLVLEELGRQQMTARRKPVEVIDLSMEAGHFGISLLGQNPPAPVRFYGLDRDPEAFDLASLLLRNARRLSGIRHFHANIALGDSILDPLPHSFPAVFDAVIGNPPWKMDHPTDGAELSRIFSPTLKGRFDIYLAFFLRADALVRPGGLIGLVVPSAFLYNQSAQGVRAQLLDRYDVLRLDVYRRRTFIELPSVAPIAIVLRKKEVVPAPSPATAIVVHTDRAGPGAADRCAGERVSDDWRRHPQSIFSHIVAGDMAWSAHGEGRLLLGELGRFSSGAHLSRIGRVETPIGFIGFTARALRPFHACENAAMHFKEGAAAFERCPPLEYLDKPKVLFQRIRCVTLPKRLVAATAGSSHLACNTTAMFIPVNPYNAAFVAALLNSSLANAWYKINDHNRSIKISVLKDMPIPMDTNLWNQIARIGRDLEISYPDNCDVTPLGKCPRYSPQEMARHQETYCRVAVLRQKLDLLVFDLYGISTLERANLTAISELRTF